MSLIPNATLPVYGTGGYMLSVDNHLYEGESVCIARKRTIEKIIVDVPCVEEQKRIKRERIRYVKRMNVLSG